MISHGYSEGWDRPHTQPKDEEDGELPGKPTSAQSSISSPPLLIPIFGLPFLLSTLGHVVQFRSLLLGTKGGDGKHLYMRPCGTGGVFMLETSVRTRWVPVPQLNQQRDLTYRRKERIYSHRLRIDEGLAVPRSSVIKIRKDVPTSIALPSQWVLLLVSALERFRPSSIEERILVIASQSRITIQKFLVIVRRTGVVSVSWGPGRRPVAHHQYNAEREETTDLHSLNRQSILAAKGLDDDFGH